MSEGMHVDKEKGREVVGEKNLKVVRAGDLTRRQSFCGRHHAHACGALGKHNTPD